MPKVILKTARVQQTATGFDSQRIGQEVEVSQAEAEAMAEAGHCEPLAAKPGASKQAKKSAKKKSAESNESNPPESESE